MSDGSDQLVTVQDFIGYRFQDAGLLLTALTHSSYSSENDVDSYERLEFLGDAVLELAVTEEIYQALGGAPEGRMTRVRAAIVDERTVASVSRLVGLPAALRLGIGEERNGGRDRSSIQSDIVESLLGAVYLDGGAEAAFAVVRRLFGDAIADRVASRQVVDSRSSLQERLAQRGKFVSFEYERTGPDHAVVYTATAYVDDEVISTGSGGSKKTAAIDAARSALESGV
ncbi:MAG: ribonuclease III [Acidimicrobiia bacterium]|nr:MAG: ribonuclease III [Acidimicrobiia bacterium]